MDFSNIEKYIRLLHLNIKLSWKLFKLNILKIKNIQLIIDYIINKLISLKILLIDFHLILSTPLYTKKKIK